MIRQNYNILRRQSITDFSLEPLYKFLKEFSLSDSLYQIGLVNSCLKYGYHETNKTDIPEPISSWVEKQYPNHSSKLMLSITITRLARFLILSKANDYKGKVLEVGSSEFEKALTLTSNLYEPSIEVKGTRKRDGSKMVGRFLQWQVPIQENRLELMGRSVLLFQQIPEKFQSDYNFSEKLLEYYGISSYEYLACGFCLWLKSTGEFANNLQMEVDSLKNIVTDEKLKVFLKLCSGTYIDYRKAIRGENWKTVDKMKDVYAMDPFALMPAIKVERSSFPHLTGEYILPQPFYLFQRTSFGIFYLLADKEREIAKSIKTNDFRRNFGEIIYRNYVKKHLEQSRTPILFFDLDMEENLSANKKKPDFALVENGVCILFEVKTSLLKLDARVYFNEEDIKSDLRQGSLKKAITQLNSFEELILSGQIPEIFSGISKVVKIIVGYEEIFMINGVLLPLIKEEYETLGNGFQFATISDIEFIGISLVNENDFCSGMVEKLNSEEHYEWPIWSFFKDKYRGRNYTNDLLRRANDAFIDQLIGSELAATIERE